MSAVRERKYQMIRVAKGDYLLPANDRRSLWRIYSYEEDGSAEWGSGQKIVGTFWAAARYDGTFDMACHDLWGLLEWHLWITHATTMATRREAIDEALRMSGAS